MPNVEAIKIFDAEVIAASGSATSVAIPTKAGKVGLNSLQLTLTGTGTAKVEVLCSIDGTNFVDPSEVGDILSSFTATSGVGSDGKEVVSIAIPACVAYKIKITETGASNSVTVTAYVGVQ
jgi:hypothetical protein